MFSKTGERTNNRLFWRYLLILELKDLQACTARSWSQWLCLLSRAFHNFVTKCLVPTAQGADIIHHPRGKHCIPAFFLSLIIAAATSERQKVWQRQALLMWVTYGEVLSPSSFTDSLMGRAAIQRDPDRLEEWAEGGLTEIRKGKCCSQ